MPLCYHHQRDTHQWKIDCRLNNEPFERQLLISGSSGWKGAALCKVGIAWWPGNAWWALHCLVIGGLAMHGCLAGRNCSVGVKEGCAAHRGQELLVVG